MQAPGKPQFQGGNPIQQQSSRNPVTSAVGGLGQAVGNLGNLALDLQKEQERQSINKAALLYSKTSAELEEALVKKRHSPEEHVDIARQKLEDVKASLLNSGRHSPAFQREMEQRADLFINGKLEEVGVNARLMQVENGKKLQLARIDSFKREGKYQEAGNLLDEGVGPYWSKEDAEIGRMSIERAERNEVYLYEAESGNVDFFSGDVEGLSPSDARRFKKKAESARARNESLEVGQIAGAIGIGEIVTKGDLARNLEGAKHITDKTAREMLKNWDNSKPLSYEEKSGMLDKMSSLHDQYRAGKISKEDYAKAHHEVSSEVFAAGNRDGVGAVKARLYALDPGKWNGDNLTAGKDTEQEMYVEDLAKTWHSSGGFGKPVKGQDALTPPQALQVEESRNLTEMAMKEWLKTDEGKKATRQEIRQQFMREASSSMSGMEVDALDSNPLNELDSILNGAGETLLPAQ